MKFSEWIWNSIESKSIGNSDYVIEFRMHIANYSSKINAILNSFDSIEQPNWNSSNDFVRNGIHLCRQYYIQLQTGKLRIKMI